MDALGFDFSYFNPLSFFENHPNIEELFLHWADYNNAGRAILNVIPDEDYPGLSLIKDYYASHSDKSFGAFVTSYLVSTQQTEFEGRSDKSAIDEKESLRFFLSVVEKCLKEAKAHHREEDNPYSHTPYSLDSDSLSDWNVEKRLWDIASKKISDMEDLMSTPYTLHLVLEDDTNVFVNEKPRYRLTLMHLEHQEITKALGPSNIFVGRYFDTQGEKAEEGIHVLRSKTKTTYRDKRIVLKRGVVIQDGKITKIDDLYHDSLTNDGPVINDPFLKDIFYKRRGDDGIGDIIETIQTNQMNIVASPYDKHIFVQGVAGSGKTMVLLQRISDMVALNTRLDPSRIVFVLPNPEFGVFFDSYFEERGLTAIGKNIMASYLMDIVSRYYEQFAESSYEESLSNDEVFAIKATVDKIKSLNLKRKWANSTCIDKNGSENIRKVMYSSPLTKLMNDVKKEHKTKKVRVGRPPRSDYESARKRFAGSYEAWVAYIRGDDPSFSKTNPYVDVADFERLVAEFLRKARSASKDKTIPLSFAGIAEAEGTISTALAYGLVKFLYETFGPLKEKYHDAFVAIDECQDYNYRIFQIIHQVELTAVLNLFGDINQDIGYHGVPWDKNQGIAEQIENHVDFKFNKFALQENYRNSNEILEFCKQNFNSKDIGYGVSTMAPARIDIKQLIALLSFHKTLRDRSAIIYHRKYEEAVRSYLKPLFAYYGFNDVKILDPVDAKGLEFDNVFVVGYPDMTFNERYVCCTRALNELYIVQTKLGEAE